MYLHRGRNCTIPATDVPLEEARLCFETNFFAIIAITQAFTPLLISAAPGSLIVNIGSIAAIVPYAFGAVYGASKAALHSFSDTLRIELEPYGVGVMVVVTGGVKSRIARTERSLPADSLYLDIDKEYQRRLKHSQEGAMDTTAYARGVVREALRRPLWMRKKKFWWGNMAWVIRFVEFYVGGWVWDIAMPRMFGLRRLAKLLKAKKKGQ